MRNNDSVVDFKRLLEDMSDAVWSISWPELDVLYVSPSSHRIFGNSDKRKAAGLQGWMNSIHPEDRLKVQESLATITQQQHTELTIRVYDSKKTMRWLQLKSRLFYDDDNKPVRVDVIGSDVTSIFESEHAKVEQDTLMNAVMNSIQEGVTFLDADLTIRKVNHTIEKWHFDKGNLVGMKCYQVYHGRQAPCEECPTMEALMTGKLVVKELTADTSQGKKWLEVSSYPVVNHTTKRTDGVVEFVRDISKHKEALQQLQESRAEYKTVVENQTDMICRFFPDTTLTYVNKAYCEAFGLTEKELIGKKFLELVPESDHQGILDQLGKLDINNRTKAYEHSIIMPDGSLRWQVWLDTAILDDAGLISQYQSVGRDITDKKQIEMAFEETLEKLQAFFEHAPLPLFIVDHDGNLVMISQHGAQLHACSPDQLIGKTLDQLFPNSNTAKMKKDINKVFRTQNPFVAIDDVMIGGRERVLQAWLFPIKKTNSGEGLVGGIIFDLTDRLEAEKTIINERMRLQHILDGTRAGTWEWNLDTGEVIVNDRWADMIGYTLSELLPMTEEKINDLSHPGDLAKAYDMLENYFKGLSDYYECEFRLRHKEGHWVWIIARGKISSRKDDGTPVMVQGTHMDITTRKIMEETLNETNARLEKAIKEVQRTANIKSEFLSTVSHEIRTPLNAITGFSQLLQKTELSLRQQNYVSTIHASSELLMKLINDILDFSKFEASKVSMNPTTVDLENLVTRTVNMFEDEANKKDLQLQVTLEKGLPSNVVVDPVRLKQVLVNLVSNAVKYTDEGTVEINVEHQRISEEKASFFFCVKDTGVGIAEDDLKLLFIPFFRSRNSQCRNEGGTGLGLAIAKEIIQCMGGNIEVTSEVGTGSVFSFSIELAYVDGQHRMEYGIVEDTGETNFFPDTGPISEEAIKVVIAEDVDTNRELTHLVTKELLPNAIIFEAADGETALRVIRETQPHIVFMDIQMPVMDGISVTKLIRGDDNHDLKHIPIIALTAGVTDEERHKCRTNGFDAFLTKPFSYEKLILEVSKCLKIRSTTGFKKGTEKSPDVTELLLEKANNDYNTYRQLLNKFMTDSTNILDIMEDAIRCNDVAGLTKASHACKGIMSVLKHTEAYECASAIDQLGKENRFEEARQAHEHLVNTVRRIIEDLPT